MSVHEAVIYSDLVRYLRDACAEMLAQAKGTATEEERKMLDDLIRTWFFTPQEELYGYTPQRIIRNEELGIENTIPAEHLDDIFDDDCHLCQMMKEEAEMQVKKGHEHGWGFGLAPDMTLLDEYDPEGWDERWRIENERSRERWEALKAEAEAFPPTGADDVSIAESLAWERHLLDDDTPF